MQLTRILPTTPEPTPINNTLPTDPIHSRELLKTRDGRETVIGVQSAFPMHELIDARRKLSEYAEVLDLEVQRTSAAIHALNAILGTETAPTRAQTSRRNQAHGQITREIELYIAAHANEQVTVDDVYEHVRNQRSAINHDTYRSTVVATIVKLCTRGLITRIEKGLYQWMSEQPNAE